MFEGFSHIYLRVRDVDESIDFYTNKLGFSLLRKYRSGDRVSAYVRLGGVLLELGLPHLPSELPGEDPVWRQYGGPARKFGIAVTDIDAAVADLKSKGVEIVRERWDARTFWGRQAVIRDPSGYEVSLREWRAPDGPDFEGWVPAHEDIERLQ